MNESRRSEKGLAHGGFSKLETRLTPNTPLIHTSFTYRKLNMDEICGLKFYLSCVHSSQKILLKSLHAERRSFLVLNLYF